MTAGFVATVPWSPLVTVVDAPVLVRWNMAFASTKTGWRRPVRQAAKTAFRLVHQRLGVPAMGRLRLGSPGDQRVFRADMSNTAYSKVLLAERTTGFEPELAALLRQLAPRLGTVFDIGANCGFFSARLLTMPDFTGHIHAFELVPSTCRALVGMREDCGFSERLTCHAFGLSDTEATVGVDVGVHSSLARIADGGTVSARVRRLDSLDLPNPDLIKIDVEGHETPVLDGARDTLSTAQPVVVFESWDRPNDTAAMRAPFDRLGDLGYSFFALRASWTADGQIRLSLDPVTPEERTKIDAQLNILAVPHGRRYLLSERFQPWSADPDPSQGSEYGADR
ncbi:FkbM family methyltransferase [Rhodovibrio sodomensis]|nr:FkbM family methyltransferase [Rhodovibrio sodomensis]